MPAQTTHPAAAWLELAIGTSTLVEAGTPPPCTGAEAGHLDDERPARAAAADACTPCPLVEQCGRYALVAGHTFGVWGGVDLTPAPGGRRSGRRELATRHEDDYRAVAS